VPWQQVTLVDQSDRFVFKPLLYELLNGAATESEVAPSYMQLLQPYPLVQYLQVGRHPLQQAFIYLFAIMPAKGGCHSVLMPLWDAACDWSRQRWLLPHQRRSCVMEAAQQEALSR
jgi:hypothetical protein